jgi:hypothetical protein
LVGAFVIILRMPPFLGVRPLFGIEAQGAGSVGGAEVVVVDGLAEVVTAVVVVAAGAVVFGGVVVAWLQLMTITEKIIIIARIT